ncbi:hypothetical protein CERZMDRAFT_93200 [Cercospora zeae-maydis SCOH1-5]|uniref:Uncharacterized protein n=1 Tax=Cercospora zeae-maydis SCOH1-5 TaxID=717836 RepID=A0A6A6FUM7_9PEZI|nr:hypothetical protein CERZMDRAFT_93200 [Cercospora zeae-maydis SCOH1-5]
MSALLHYVAIVHTSTGKIYRRIHAAPACFHIRSLATLQEWCRHRASEVADQDPSKSIGWSEQPKVTGNLAGEENIPAVLQAVDRRAMIWVELEIFFNITRHELFRIPTADPQLENGLEGYAIQEPERQIPVEDAQRAVEAYLACEKLRMRPGYRISECLPQKTPKPTKKSKDRPVSTTRTSGKAAVTTRMKTVHKTYVRPLDRIRHRRTGTVARREDDGFEDGREAQSNAKRTGS